eukprot:TRINITY_DN74366_c0_g1_i1.p1 TRINITY_DN74366_c0_g1~~TRINITY_DN74366_c0_g1_i1.p1  ORF type:complete len:253 (+),score=39.33 TRINITY_DN74366_c0_g1_i1:56-760(+)
MASTVFYKGAGKRWVSAHDIGADMAEEAESSSGRAIFVVESRRSEVDGQVQFSLHAATTPEYKWAITSHPEQHFIRLFLLEQPSDWNASQTSAGSSSGQRKGDVSAAGTDLEDTKDSEGDTHPSVGSSPWSRHYSPAASKGSWPSSRSQPYPVGKGKLYEPAMFLKKDDTGDQRVEASDAGAPGHDAVAEAEQAAGTATDRQESAIQPRLAPTAKHPPELPYRGTRVMNVWRSW